MDDRRYAACRQTAACGVRGGEHDHEVRGVALC